MKKSLAGLLLGLVSSLSVSIYACTVTFINDLSYPVTLIFDDQTSMRLNAQDQTTFGDPDALASFIVLKRVGQRTNKYRLTQVSCSPTHQIDIYASAIGQSPIEYFEVSKNLNAAASGGCGCGHKDRPR